MKIEVFYIDLKIAVGLQRNTFIYSGRRRRRRRRRGGGGERRRRTEEEGGGER